MSYRKIVCLDFDGVIHSYKSGWKGIDYIPDEPVPGIREAIDDLMKDYDVYVFSTRCTDPDGKYAVQVWLDYYKIRVTNIVSHKPPAYVTIDDRCICFKGKPKLLRKQIEEFKTYMEEGNYNDCKTI